MFCRTSEVRTSPQVSLLWRQRTPFITPPKNYKRAALAMAQNEIGFHCKYLHYSCILQSYSHLSLRLHMGHCVTGEEIRNDDVTMGLVSRGRLFCEPPPAWPQIPSAGVPSVSEDAPSCVSFPSFQTGTGGKVGRKIAPQKSHLNLCFCAALHCLLSAGLSVELWRCDQPPGIRPEIFVQ